MFLRQLPNGLDRQNVRLRREHTLRAPHPPCVAGVDGIKPPEYSDRHQPDQALFDLHRARRGSRPIRDEYMSLFALTTIQRRLAATRANFALVRTEGNRQVTRNVPHFNLDAAISVGYRVNSKRGVKFRQWATKTLNDHLVLGYTVNQRRQLAERDVVKAQQTISLLARTLSRQEDLTDESRQVLDIVTGYAKTWKTLRQYDENALSVPEGTPSIRALEYESVQHDIKQLKQALMAKGEATELFGQERENALLGSLGSIDQTMFGDPLYKSAEEKAANLSIS